MKGGKWLILTQYYPPEVGSPQIRLPCLARELRRYGIDVEVLTAMPNYPTGKVFPGYGGRMWMREVIQDVPVHRVWIYAGSGKSSRVRLANYLSFTLTSLIAAVINHHPNVIFVEAQPLSLGLVAALKKWLRNVSYIYHVPDLQIDVAQQLGFVQSPHLLTLARKLDDFFLRHAWKISTPTEHFVNYLEGRGISREKITFLPNGADADFLKPQRPDPDLLDHWKIHGKKIFLYLGTHGYYHGLDTLIEAAALLRHRDDLVFLMIGDGPDRPRLMNMASAQKLNNVIFGGQYPYSEIAKLHSIAYASVATLRKMEVGKSMRLHKMFPSMSCGVPVILSGEGEGADILANHCCGITVEPERSDLLAQAIEHLAGDQFSRDNMGRAGRQLIEREYSWTSIVKRWLAELNVC